MSRSLGKVLDTEGDLLGFFLYNGTANQAQPWIEDTEDSAFPDDWREREWKKCVCGQDPVEVILWLSYNLLPYGYGGSYWPSHACVQCRVITGVKNPWDHERSDDEYRPKIGPPPVVVNSS